MKKKNKIILLTITLSLILLSVGLSFAFFTSINNNESASTLYAKGGTMNIKYANGSGNIVMENIYPREQEWAIKTFTVTGNNTTELEMDYRIYLVTSSNAFNYGDLTYSISGTSTNTSDTLVQKTNQSIPKTGEILMGKGTFKAKNSTHTYTLKIYYKETGENQNNGQEKDYTGYVRIDTGSTLGYDSLINLKDNDPSSESAVFNGPIARNKVETITFKTDTIVPSNALFSWDASEKQNGSVMAYTLDENKDNLYELYIGQDNKVVLGPDASHMFQNYNNSATIDVSNLDTSNVTSMDYMFRNATVTNIIGLNKFDTSKVVGMNMTFAGMKNITNIDLSSFDTHNVQGFYRTFQGVEKVETLDVSSFNTSNAITMEGMFYYMSNLKNIIGLENFDTANVENMLGMFSACFSIEELNLNSFVIKENAYIRQMFSGMKNLKNLYIKSMDFSVNIENYSDFFNNCNIENIYVKDEAAKTWIEARLTEAHKTANVQIAN